MRRVTPRPLAPNKNHVSLTGSVETPAGNTPEAVVYCRVSSERQAKEGDGARSQEQRCRAYALSLNYRVLCAFSDDGVSGAAIDRPGLLALLQFVQSRRDAGKRETIVIVDDISRLARDVPAHIQIRASIRAAGGRLESPSFTFGDSAADELVETIMAATAQFGRKGNREQVLNRMKARLEQGYWTFPPPLGYRYERHPVHKKWMVPTPTAKNVLGQALEGFASGRFQTQRELARHLREVGFFADFRVLHIGVLEKRVGRMLELAHLYAGQVEYNEWNIARRNAQHPAVITPNTLRRIEERLAQPGRPTGALRADTNALFPLRNFVRCRECGRPLTGSLAKGQYPRYHCYWHGCSLKGDSFSANEKVHPMLMAYLHSITPEPEMKEMIEKQLARLWAGWKGEQQSATVAAERELAEVKRSVQSLIRRLARVDDEAVAGEVEREVGALKTQEAVLLRRIEGKESAPDYRAAWEAVHTYFLNPAGKWESGDASQKRTVQRMVFAHPPVYVPKVGIHTTGLSLPYRVSEAFKTQNAKVVDLAGKSSHLIQPSCIGQDDWDGFFDALADWAQWIE